MRMGESQGTQDRAFQRNRQVLVYLEDFQRDIAIVKAYIMSLWSCAQSVLLVAN
jgi:hypothetical protein